LKQGIYRYVPNSIKNARAARSMADSVSRMALRAARMRSAGRGHAFAGTWHDTSERESAGQPSLPASTSLATNPLEEFFEARTEGRGIFKWRHYFEVYHRHLAKFVGERTALLEVGIAGGGSLDMWRQFLGPGCDLYGVDIDPAYRKPDDVTVFIGDQADRAFWERFRAKTPLLDIVIDDGGHAPEQQRVTLEELLPRLRPGGVYICEDVHGDDNPFLGFVYGLSRGLFAYDLELDAANRERSMTSAATPFQSVMHSVHLYPYLVVIERRQLPLDEFVASMHGTEWPEP
jgi:hypothetical protein